MVIFHSYVNVCQGVSHFRNPLHIFLLCFVTRKSAFTSKWRRLSRFRRDSLLMFHPWTCTGNQGHISNICDYIYIIIVLLYIHIVRFMYIYNIYIYIISSLYVLYYVTIHVCVYWYYIYMLFLKSYMPPPKTYLSSKFNDIYIVFLNPFNSKT